jgi:deoxyribodipyrimidine photolyase
MIPSYPEDVKMSLMPQIVWFKRDLRVHDHAPLFEAQRHGPIIPLYIIEPDLWRLPDSSARHEIAARWRQQDFNDEARAVHQRLGSRQGSSRRARSARPSPAQPIQQLSFDV